MPYNKNLDKKLYEQSIEYWYYGDREGTKITVAVYSYDNHEPKLQIIREVLCDSYIIPSKLGRLSLCEMEMLSPLLSEAKEIMSLKPSLDKEEKVVRVKIIKKEQEHKDLLDY